MQSKQNSLVPIREAFGGLDGPVKEIREASPQARHHFTQADQVNQLVGARPTPTPASAGRPIHAVARGMPHSWDSPLRLRV